MPDFSERSRRFAFFHPLRRGRLQTVIHVRLAPRQETEKGGSLWNSVIVS